MILYSLLKAKLALDRLVCFQAHAFLPLELNSLMISPTLLAFLSLYHLE